MNNKAILLRSVSAIATAAASTAGGVQHASAQVLTPGADGYYYSVTGGLMFSPSERFLTEIEDKVGLTAQGYTSGSSYNYSSYGSAWYEEWNDWSNSGYSYSSGLDDFKGIFGSVSFGKQLDPTWDIRGTLSATGGGTTTGSAYATNYHSSYTYFSGNDGSGSSYSGNYWNYGRDTAWASGEYKFGFAAADFEVGYTPVLSDTFSVRLFAGLRALKFKSTFMGSAGSYGYEYSGYYEDWDEGPNYSSSYSYSSYTNFFDGEMNVEFTGVGPRVGAQMATRFEGTNFGLSGSVAASVLFGKKTVSSSGYYYSSSYYSAYWAGSGIYSGGSTYYSSAGSGYSSYSDESSQTVLDLQASIGVDYYLNDNTALTVGYQAEKLMELDGDDMGLGTSIDTLVHGAFVKLSGTF